MEVEDELFIEDNNEILDIINFGFPRRIFARSNHLEDMSFFRRFRLTKETTITVLEMIENNLEFENDMNNSVSPINQLLTALVFHASNGHQISVADFMKMDQATVSRIITKVSAAIAGLRNRFITMPTTPEERLTCQNNFYRLARFPRVVGSIDCTHVKICSPGGDDGEVFRNRKSYFSINVQVVCNRELLITNIVARWPGSAHDCTIFNNSRIRTRLEAGEFGNGILLGDSRYALKAYLLTPLLNPAGQAQERYNESHIRTRNAIERTFGVWKRRFPVLSYGLRCKIDTTLTIIVATAVLHNIACNMNNAVPPPPIGINAEDVEYLIEQGQIPPIHVQQNVRHNFRNEIINDFFARL